MGSAFYNEIDPFAAAWLRELIKAKLIADGEVDERSIEDVTPNDVRGFTQCHFFAGIGVWSYALRRVGWPDDQRVWTGSAPCQPFSAAGKGGGFADERHLWPAYFHLIHECRPDTILGEQVASKDGLAWLDLVSSDLEGAGYTFGAVDSCAAGFGAPHIRQRMYFVADSQRSQLRAGRSGSVGATAAGVQSPDGQRERLRDDAGKRGAGCGLEIPGPQSARRGLLRSEQSSETDRRGASSQPERSSGVDELVANNNNTRLEGREFSREGSAELVARESRLVNGFWRDAEWIYCRDEKFRAIEPGAFPLAHGASNRVGRLRGYGNAIVAPQAEEFIRAYLETCTENGLAG